MKKVLKALLQERLRSWTIPTNGNGGLLIERAVPGPLAQGDSPFTIRVAPPYEVGDAVGEAEAVACLADVPQETNLRECMACHRDTRVVGQETDTPRQGFVWVQWSETEADRWYRLCHECFAALVAENKTLECPPWVYVGRLQTYSGPGRWDDAAWNFYPFRD